MEECVVRCVLLCAQLRLNDKTSRIYQWPCAVACKKIILKLLFHLKKMELHNLFSALFVLSLSPLTRSPAFMPALPHSHKHYALTCEKEQAR